MLLGSFSQGHLKTISYATFGGVNRVHHGRFENYVDISFLRYEK